MHASFDDKCGLWNCQKKAYRHINVALTSQAIPDLDGSKESVNGERNISTKCISIPHVRTASPVMHRGIYTKSCHPGRNQPLSSQRGRHGKVSPVRHYTLVHHTSGYAMQTSPGIFDRPQGTNDRCGTRRAGKATLSVEEMWSYSKRHRRHN